MPILSMFISNQISLFRRGAAHLARYGAANLSVTVALAAAIRSPHYSLPRPFTLFSFAAIAIAFGYAMEVVRRRFVRSRQKTRSFEGLRCTYRTSDPGHRK